MRRSSAPLGLQVCYQMPHPRRQAGCLIRQDRGQALLELPAALRHRYAALEEQRPHLVDERSAPRHQPLSDPMQRLQVELRLALKRHEAHRRPLRRLGRCFAVPVVILVVLDVGAHVLGRHQPHLVSLRGQVPAQVVRAAARLKADNAARQVRRQRQHPVPAHPPAQHDRARSVEPHHVHHPLP
jgi:hypothetical protein